MGPKVMHPFKQPTPVGQKGDLLIYRKKKGAASVDPIHISPLIHTPTLASNPTLIYPYSSNVLS